MILFHLPTPSYFLFLLASSQQLDTVTNPAGYIFYYSVCQFSYIWLPSGGYREFQSHNINDVIHGASDAGQVIILLLLLNKAAA